MVAFDGVVLGDLATPCEIFWRAAGQAGRSPYEVRVCSAARTVRSSFVTLTVPHRLTALSAADTIMVPGMEDIDRPVDPAVVRALRQAARRGARIASICTGAFVLAAAGLLDGKRATTHWRGAAELSRRYVHVEVDASVLFVDQGQLLTSAGAAAGLDLCLHMVRRDLGAAAAAAAARLAVMPLERAGGQAQFITYEPPAEESGSLAPLLQWLEQNLHRELTLPRLARRAGLSTRTLSRSFLNQVGTTPAAWVARARVRRAQHLLETTALPVERVAAEVGFGSAAVLRARFAEVVGTSPLAYRRSFRGDAQLARPSREE